MGYNIKSKIGFNSKLKPTSRTILEIRDVDYLTMLDDVQEAVKRRLTEDKLKISLIDTNNKGLRMTIVQLNKRHAVDLLKTRRIKVESSRK